MTVTTTAAITIAAVSASAFILGACRRDAAPETTAAAAPVERSAAVANGRVTLDDAQLAQIKVEALTATTTDEVIRATGTVEFNADRVARILAPVSGQVQDLRVNVGDDVRRGATLFVLSSREVAAAIADHLASQKDLDLAEKTFAMTKDLFEHQAASRISLQQSENELAKARAKVAQTDEVLRVLGFDDAPESAIPAQASRVPIRSPIAGTVTERTITNGQFVGSDSTPLLTIADLSTVWVQADVFERDLHRIAAGQKADVTSAAYPDDHFQAEVSRIGTVVDAQTRTAKMRFVVANPGLRLKPGMFTTAELHVGSSGGPAVLTVPARAVFVEDSRSYAYVEAARGQFVRREIQTERGIGDRVRVSRGLSLGDRVVSEGVLLLRARETDGASQ